MRHLCGIIGVACATHAAAGQTAAREPMRTDRPDFTEGTRAVGSGRWQIEGGYSLVVDDEGGQGVREHTLPEFLLRVGVAPAVELRFGWEGYTWGPDPVADGLDDARLGVKIHLLEQEGLVPDFGVIGEVSLPTGSGQRGSDSLDPAVKLLWAYDLGERAGIAGNLNFAWASGEDGGRDLETGASLSLSYDWTERLGTFWEYVGIFPLEARRDEEHTLGLGATFTITADLQLDASVAFGLNDAAPDMRAGAGFALRW
jgi:hypothetical protein